MSDRVWVVDDNELVLRMIYDILSKNGYYVNNFNHPAIVMNKLMNIDSLQMQLPQVMLVDYWLPDMNGVEMIKQIRSLGTKYSNISFVGMSNSNGKHVDEEFAKLGVFVLRKPNFNESDMLIKIMRAQVERQKTNEWKLY